MLCMGFHLLLHAPTTAVLFLLGRFLDRVLLLRFVLFLYGLWSFLSGFVLFHRGNSLCRHWCRLFLQSIFRRGLLLRFLLNDQFADVVALRYIIVSVRYFTKRSNKIVIVIYRPLNFRNTIIVLTSNVGTRQVLEFGGGVGFNSGAMDQKETNRMLLKALQKQFPPEFVNRIDNVVTFEPLNKETIGQIVRIEIGLLQQRLKTHGHQLSVTPEAVGEIVEKSYDTKNGARPVKRAVQTYLEDPLTEILLRKPNQKRITIKKIEQV